MSIRAARPTDPAPLVVTLWTDHMITPTHLLNSDSAFGAVREVTFHEPVSDFFSQGFLTVLLGFVDLPRDLAFPTELELAMLALHHLCLVLVALGNLIALWVWTISLL